MQSEFTPSMQRVIAYFEALGPRWGLQPKTCAAHALLFLAGRWMSPDEVAQHLGLDPAAAKAAIDDLIGWRVVETSAEGRIRVDGEPWDLLFAGMEERRRREIGPALQAIGEAARLASNDGTPRHTALRINNLKDLLQDLSALGDQLGRVPARTLQRFVRLGGQFSKLLRR